jgi:choline-sulfatase
VDIAPTVVELAGGDPGPGMDGRSLVPLLAGERAGWREDWLYLSAYRRGSRPDLLALRASDRKYVRYLAGGLEEQLFDLRADPDERVNLAGRPEDAAELERLRRRMAELMGELAVPLEWLEAKAPGEGAATGRSR